MYTGNVHLYFLGLITEWVPGQGGIHRNVQKSKRLEGTRNKRGATTALSSRPKCLCVYLFLTIKDKTGSYWTVLPSQIKELMLWKAKIIVQRNASPGSGGGGAGGWGGLYGNHWPPGKQYPASEKGFWTNLRMYSSKERLMGTCANRGEGSEQGLGEVLQMPQGWRPLEASEIGKKARCFT